MRALVIGIELGAVADVEADLGSGDLAGSGQDPKEVFAKDGLLDALKKALAERILDAELDQHLAVERVQSAPEALRNHRKVPQDGVERNRQAVDRGTAKRALSHY